MGKWMIGVVAVFFVTFGITVIVSGEPAFLIAPALLAVLGLAYAGLNRLLARRIVHKHHGDWDEAMSDSEDPIPAAHLIPDSERPLGDTPEAHDELNPHDLPVGHPGRAAAEEQAGDGAGEERTTRGDRSA